MAKTQPGGLGRGIDALFGSSESTISSSKVVEQANQEEAAAKAAAEAAAAEAAAAKKAAEEAAAKAAAEAAAAAEQLAEQAKVVDTATMADILDASNVDGYVVRERAARPKKEEPALAPAPVIEPAPAAEPVFAPAPETIPDGSIANIALDLITPNPFQPRLRFKQEQLEELAASIAREGLIQPITVRPLPDGHFQIVSGERRFRASHLAGMPAIPAYILAANDIEMAEYALVENLQREDLNPIEAAIGYRNLMNQQNLTQSDLATILCKGRSTIANTLRLLDLPEDLQEMIYNDQLTEGHARAIQGVPTAEGRKKLADKVVAEGLSVRATESIARLMSGRGTEADEAQAGVKEKPVMPPAFKVIARNLKKRLGTNVKVKNAGGKNKLEIEFADTEDLERIVNALLGETVED